MQNQINLSPITQFIQQVRSAEQSQSKEVKMSLQQARMLTLVLAECMDKLTQDYETMFNTLKRSTDNEIISVQMDGGGFEVPK
jgi:nitrate reductase assembly molybdenum cofactor insertion protein NarJ